MSDGTEQNREHFERIKQAARDGLHLPTLGELLRACPLLGESLATDAQAFAERLLPRVVDDGDAGSRLRAALATLTVAPHQKDFRAAHEAFLAVHAFDDFDFDDGSTNALAPDPGSGAMRCALYAAMAGCRTSAWMVAAEALARAYGTNGEEFAAYVESALGWLLIASSVVPDTGRRQVPWAGSSPGDRALHLGRTLLGRLRDLVQPEPAEAAFVSVPPSTPTSLPPESVGVVVFHEVGSTETQEGKRVAKEYATLLGKPLPLVPVPDLRDVRRTLLADFPHAGGVIDGILADVGTFTRGVRFRPTVLVGQPGCGKTMFAGRLFAALGVHREVYSCGGVSDPALAGTPRRWSTGEPSLPVALAKRWMTASPGIVLDEVEKVGTSRQNGNLLDALLGLLEPESNGAWHDPYLEAAVDLSHVLWIGTANSLDSLPGPLRDRCRVIVFPEPTCEHLEAIAASLLRKAVLDRGMDARWAVPLDGEEIEALRRHWHGGSVRRLARLVEGILGARDLDGNIQ